jgi:hypothetical protein
MKYSKTAKQRFWRESISDLNRAEVYIRELETILKTEPIQGLPNHVQELEWYEMDVQSSLKCFREFSEQVSLLTAKCYIEKAESFLEKSKTIRNKYEERKHKKG